VASSEAPIGALMAYRRATWRSRPLPGLVIVGAQKSGTTSLLAYLSQHPQLVPAVTGTVHFFDGGRRADVDDYAKGESWYRAHFPAARNLGPDSQAFEASPLYMFHPLVARRMFELLPHVKIVALLRNPSERAISHYFHEKRKGREELPIMQAMEAEEERLAPVLRTQDYKNQAFRSYSYKSRGLYLEQLDRFLEHFSREQILLLSSEEFFRRPPRTLKRVFEFVGVDESFNVTDLTPRNVGNRPGVDPGVYEYLNDYFSEPNAALSELLGMEFGW